MYLKVNNFRAFSRKDNAMGFRIDGGFYELKVEIASKTNDHGKQVLFRTFSRKDGRDGVSELVNSLIN